MEELYSIKLIISSYHRDHCENIQANHRLIKIRHNIYKILYIYNINSHKQAIKGKQCNKMVKD